MSLQWCAQSQQLQHCCSLSFSHHKKNPLVFARQRRKLRNCVAVAVAAAAPALRLEDLAEIAHNKVLIAAAASAAIGQLSKPFTSSLFYGRDLDFKTAFGAGGFPSTHSSAVVATATSLALERGFADSIFGLSVVYAGLIMYDAQGVRREVGNHAKALNRVMPKTQVTSIPFEGNNELIDSQPGRSSLDESSSFASEPIDTPFLLRSDKEIRRSSQTLTSSVRTDSVEEVLERVGNITPLKESIGHTEVEVIAGAVLGFCASLAVYMIM